jgi:RHS repeat-associated protein
VLQLHWCCYYPFGLVQQGISSKAANIKENKAKFNGIEHNTDFDLNTYEAFYRTLDPQIGRFLQIDPKPTDMVSVYSAMNNDPILYSDPLGDTTWVYDLLGNQLNIINSKTKNQIHYIDAEKYGNLEMKNTSQGKDLDNAGDPVVNNKQLEKDVRKGSKAFFGSKSAADLQKILNDPKNASPMTDGNEALFTASISKSRELRFSQVDGIQSANSVINNPGKQIDNVLSNAIQASLFGAGHSHPTKTFYGGSALNTLMTTTVPSSRFMGAGGQWNLQDFNPILYRSTTGSKSQHALFVAARVGFSTYSSGSTSAYPTPGNGMFYYSQFKK